MKNDNWLGKDHVNNQKKALIITNQSGFLWKFELSNVKLLQDLGYEIHYASNSAEEGYYYKPENLKQMGIIFHNIEIARSPYMIRMNWNALRELIQIIENEGIDIVHCHTPVGGLLGRMAGVLSSLKPKVIYTAHGFHFYKGAPWINNIVYQGVERLMAIFTDELVLINKEDYLKACTFRLRRNGKIHRIPGIGIDLSQFYPASEEEKRKIRKKIGIDEDAFFILSVGELNKNKNHRTIIQVMKKITDDNILDGKVIYGICGDGFLRNELRHFADENCSKDQIRFFGYQCEIRDYYAAADVTVFPSRREGFGMVGLESLAMGIPVVASDNRGTREYMQHGKNGYVCRYDDIDGFIAGIKKIRELSSAELKEMRCFCVNSTRDFSKENTNLIMQSIYEELNNKVEKREKTVN